MASITPTLTIASTDAFANQSISLSAGGSAITVAAPMSDISRMATNDNIGHGAGVILPDLVTARYYVYIRHTGLIADGSADSDYGTTNNTASHATNDFVLVSTADADAASKIVKLQPGEFAFFPLAGNDDTSDDGAEPGGLKRTKGNSAEPRVEFAYCASTI